MAKRLIINMGFITNSSSAIHWFPKELLEDPEVRAFMSAYGIANGFVGNDLWYRSACETIALTKEQKQETKTQLGSSDYDSRMGGAVDPEDENTFVIIYGDEYSSVTSELAHLLSRVADKKGLSHAQDEYN